MAQRWKRDEAVDAILAELCAAERKHPGWPNDLFESMAIIGEEYGEACQAVLQFKYEDGQFKDIIRELRQTAAMCIRTLINMEEPKDE
jgi:hypothetical protein